GHLGRRRRALEDLAEDGARLGGGEVVAGHHAAKDAGPTAQLSEGHRAERKRQAVRRRWRMMRRRSRSVAPPHTPSFSRDAKACSRHAWRTEQTAQIPFASSASSSDTG